jgi:hypothetical protein
MDQGKIQRSFTIEGKITGLVGLYRIGKGLEKTSRFPSGYDMWSIVIFEGGF